MALTDYTTCNDIRAALGVSDEELGDDTLSLELYEYNLMQDLMDVGDTLGDDYLVVADLTVKTPQAVKFYQATRLFSTYAVARQLLGSLPLFSPKEVSDGKATMSRFSQNPYQDTIKTVKEQYDKFKTRLEAAYSTFKVSDAPVMTVRTLMAIATPANDPVTGK
jgi:hypothetical protein